MVHPRDLLRVDSDAASRFSAPIGTATKNPVDCGLSAFSCLNRCCNLERFAKPKLLIFLIGHIGMIQGALWSYFQGTSVIWKEEYGLSNTLVDWLLRLNEIFAALIALVVAYWGDRIHRASWIGGLIIFNAIFGLILIVPEIYDPFSGSVLQQNDTDVLCSTSSSFNNPFSSNVTEENAINEVAVGSLFIYQLFSALGNIAFYTIGLSYLDDSVDITLGPIYIAGALALREIGKQTGMYLSWTAITSSSSVVFLAPAFLALTCVLFIFGVITAMFPKSLPDVLLKKAVASILDIASGVESSQEEQPIDGFFTSLWRILRNKILVFNIMASTFVLSALINYDLLKTSFYQSFYFLSAKNFDPAGYSDPWLTQIITHLLKPPFMAVNIVAAGLVISKFKPKAKKLATFNIGALMFAVITFGSNIFTSCDKSFQTEMRNKVTIPFCSSRCACSDDIPFTPVCTEVGQTTYFSPCHAGCSAVQDVNNVKIYMNCTCGNNIHTLINARATEGGCNTSCEYLWGLAQVSSVTIAGILSATIMTTLMISLRCVKPCDKSITLALHMTFNGLIPYIPFRIVYLVVSDQLCQYRATSGFCRLHSNYLGIFLLVTTMVLLIIAMILYGFVAYFVRNLDLYEEPKNENATDKINDEEIEELETRRDNGGTANLFRTSSPSTTGNQDLRLQDFSPEPTIDEESPPRASNNNVDSPTERDHLLKKPVEVENLNFSLKTPFPEPPPNRNVAKVEVHSNPKSSDSDSFVSVEGMPPKKNDSKTSSQLLESDF